MSGTMHQKVTLERPDGKEGCLVLRVKGETHTLGNLLERELLKDARVSFAAYKVDHPLVEEVNVTILAEVAKPEQCLIPALRSAIVTLGDLIGQLDPGQA